MTRQLAPAPGCSGCGTLRRRRRPRASGMRRSGNRQRATARFVQRHVE